MKLNNFTSNNLNDVANYIHIYQIKEINPLDYRKLLSNISISFELENINRLQSTLLCELGFSYVQQSQRYVEINYDTIPVVSESLPYELYSEGLSIFDNAISLYTEMTELKKIANIKKRLTAKDFKYGIPYEDARYCLPLCMPTNIVITISGDQLIDLYNYAQQYPITLNPIIKLLDKHIPVSVRNFILSTIQYSKSHNYNLYGFELEKLYNDDETFVKILSYDTIENAARGALASQNLESPSTIYQAWNNTDVDKKCTNLVNNVLSYGHESIIEQMRNTSVMKCSLSTYHQVIRHRLQNINRQDIMTLCKNRQFKFYVPESIRLNREFYLKYTHLMQQYQKLFNTMHKKYNDEFISEYLPNAAYICFSVNSNARNDNWIFRERLCLTAQTEIRDLYIEKFKLLYPTCECVYKRGLPPCASDGKCKEGKYTCGNKLAIKSEFKKYL